MEYEGLPTICYHCGCYGHLEEVCPQKNQPEPAAANPIPGPRNAVHSPAREPQAREGKLFGDWMVAPKRTWRVSRQEPGTTRQNGVKQDNRYDILTSSDAEPQHENGNEHPPESNNTSQAPLRHRNQDKPREAKQKSKTIHAQKAATPDIPKSTPTTKPNGHSLFNSRAYSESTSSTSLDPTCHTVVSLHDPQQAQIPPTLPAQFPASNPAPPHPTPNPQRSSKPHPNKGPTTGGVKMPSSLKVRSFKHKPEVLAGPPSDKLAQAIAEGLGAQLSDDDSTFAEAVETAFEDDEIFPTSAAESH